MDFEDTLSAKSYLEKAKLPAKSYYKTVKLPAKSYFFMVV